MALAPSDALLRPKHEHVVQARRPASACPVAIRNGIATLRRRLPAARLLERSALSGATPQGDCPVCGNTNVRFRNFTQNLRESGHCDSCGASNRQRQMAVTLRRILGLAPTGMLAPLADCAIYSAEANGPLHKVLAAHPRHIASEFFGAQYASGATINGTRHEDLQNLSFRDASLDLVLSSDVLEHVPDAYRAHQEIFRVLRPGGWHIFTVPFREAPADDVRAVPRDGQPVHLAPPLYHGDPVRPEQGVLVWRIFGYEMLSRLRRIGFTPTIHRLFAPTQGIIGPGAIVFVAGR